MCEPRRWWWGLVPLAVLWIAASSLLTPLIESEITHRAVRTLTDSSGPALPVKLAIEGRDVVIEGVAPPNDRLHGLVLNALEVDGVRLVVNNTKPQTQTTTFRWQATRDEKSVTLSGQVAADGAREEIIAVVKKVMPGLALNDQMIDAGAVAAEMRSMAASALAQLAKLRSGTVALIDNSLSIVGTTVDEASAVALTVAASQLPPPLRVATVDVRGPASRSNTAARSMSKVAAATAGEGPFVWSAVKDPEGIRLTGSTPSESAREQLIAAAKAIAGPGRVIDKLKIAAGPDAAFDYATAETFAVGQLAHLRTGSVKLTDGKMTIEGEATDAAAFDAATAATSGTLPGGLKMDRVSIVPPRIPTYKWSAERKGKTVTLTGSYPDQLTRQAMLMAINQRFADFALHDRTTIASGAPAGFAPAMAMGLDQLAKLESGEASIAAGRFTLSGIAASTKVATDAKEALTKLVGGMPAQARVTIVAAARAASPISPLMTEAPASQSQVEPTAAAPVAAPCTAALAAASNTGKIQFGSSKAVVLPASIKVIQRIATAMKGCPALKIEIAGHTDGTGSSVLNDTLSKSRAEAIAEALIKSGIAAVRVTAVGYGSARPVADNVTPAGKARNRRIEFNAR